MKKVLILALGVMMIASLSYAVDGQPFIGVFVDQGATDCTLDVLAPNLYSVYLVQTGQSGISCSAMIVDSGIGIALAGVDVMTPLSIGNAFTGIEFSYGVCDPDGIVLAKINYTWFGSPAITPCSSLEVVDHPMAGGILVADCTLPSPVLHVAQGGLLTVNGDPGICPDRCAWQEPNAVEQTSWGQIKALYTEE